MKVGGCVYATADSDIYVNLYIGGTASIALRDNKVTVTQQTEYPWSGAVRITVDPEGRSAFSMNLRIPGWCRSARVKLNGAELRQQRVLKGYVCIKRTWKAGDVIELDFAMPVERIEAHPNVAANRRRVAIQRGPVVYGIEGLDNDGNVDIVLAADPQFETETRRDFLGGVTVVKGKSAEGKTLTAIPFYVLANRGKSSQTVWLAQKRKKENPAGWQGRLYRRLDPGTLIH